MFQLYSAQQNHIIGSGGLDAAPASSLPNETAPTIPQSSPPLNSNIMQKPSYLFAKFAQLKQKKQEQQQQPEQHDHVTTNHPRINLNSPDSPVLPDQRPGITKPSYIKSKFAMLNKPKEEAATLSSPPTPPTTTSIDSPETTPDGTNPPPEQQQPQSEPLFIKKPNVLSKFLMLKRNQAAAATVYEAPLDTTNNKSSPSNTTTITTTIPTAVDPDLHQRRQDGILSTIDQGRDPEGEATVGHDEGKTKLIQHFVKDKGLVDLFLFKHQRKQLVDLQHSQQQQQQQQHLHTEGATAPVHRHASASPSPHTAADFKTYYRDDSHSSDHSTTLDEDDDGYERQQYRRYNRRREEKKKIRRILALVNKPTIVTTRQSSTLQYLVSSPEYPLDCPREGRCAYAWDRPPSFRFRGRTLRSRSRPLSRFPPPLTSQHHSTYNRQKQTIGLCFGSDRYLCRSSAAAVVGIPQWGQFIDRYPFYDPIAPFAPSITNLFAFRRRAELSPVPRNTPIPLSTYTQTPTVEMMLRFNHARRQVRQYLNTPFMFNLVKKETDFMSLFPYSVCIAAYLLILVKIYMDLRPIPPWLVVPFFMHFFALFACFLLLCFASPLTSLLTAPIPPYCYLTLPQSDIEEGGGDDEEEDDEDDDDEVVGDFGTNSLQVYAKNGLAHEASDSGDDADNTNECSHSGDSGSSRSYDSDEDGDYNDDDEDDYDEHDDRSEEDNHSDRRASPSPSPSRLSSIRNFDEKTNNSSKFGHRFYTSHKNNDGE